MKCVTLCSSDESWEQDIALMGKSIKIEFNFIELIPFSAYESKRCMSIGKKIHTDAI